MKRPLRGLFIFNMKILFLGTGTSTGVPSLCCDCEVCLSNDLRNKRLRASILIQNEGNHILIDTSTDLRQQCLANGIKHIDSVLYTHHHADHVHGIDELRSFNYFNNTATPCYGSKATLNNLADKFDYIFNPGIQLGGGLPRLNFHTVDHESFMLEGVEITPLDIQRIQTEQFRLYHRLQRNSGTFPGETTGTGPFDPERVGVHPPPDSLLSQPGPGGH